MKSFSGIFILLLFFIIDIQAQTQEEADRFYHDYRFDEAIEVYDQMAKKLIKAKKTEEAEALQPLIDKTSRAARFLSRCEDIQIIDSIILPKSHFLDAYLISADAGKLTTGNNHIYYINQLGDKRYFASKNEHGRYRLYSELNLQNEWSDISELKLPSDSIADDNYPFVMSDGITLYYASTGHGSLGGYDLFVSRYNYDSGVYFAPTQLGMPFNSPANDYMMVVDELNAIGYFATDRNQEEGKVIIYTFIPSESVSYVEYEDEEGGENLEYLINRAKITSIKDSWKQTSYSAYLQQIREVILNEQEKASRDFTFYINDEIVYYTEDDFRDISARQSFVRWQALEKQIESLEAELNGQREEYATANAQRKSAMKEIILRNEKQLSNLKQQWEQMAMRIRNQEIKHLEIN